MVKAFLDNIISLSYSPFFILLLPTHLHLLLPTEQVPAGMLQDLPQTGSHQRYVESVDELLYRIHYARLHTKEILQNLLQIAAVVV